MYTRYLTHLSEKGERCSTIHLGDRSTNPHREVELEASLDHSPALCLLYGIEEIQNRRVPAPFPREFLFLSFLRRVHCSGEHKNCKPLALLMKGATHTRNHRGAGPECRDRCWELLGSKRLNPILDKFVSGKARSVHEVSLVRRI